MDKDRAIEVLRKRNEKLEGDIDRLHEFIEGHLGWNKFKNKVRMFFKRKAKLNEYETHLMNTYDGKIDKKIFEKIKTKNLKRKP